MTPAMLLAWGPVLLALTPFVVLAWRSRGRPAEFYRRMVAAVLLDDLAVREKVLAVSRPGRRMLPLLALFAVLHLLLCRSGITMVPRALGYNVLPLATALVLVFLGYAAHLALTSALAVTSHRVLGCRFAGPIPKVWSLDFTPDSRVGVRDGHLWVDGRKLPVPILFQDNREGLVSALYDAVARLGLRDAPESPAPTTPYDFPEP
ncbi:MAG: hypothetical protein AB7D57_09390 [Desulfovibrionaceae bacterium]